MRDLPSYPDGSHVPTHQVNAAPIIVHKMLTKSDPLFGVFAPKQHGTQAPSPGQQMHAVDGNARRATGRRAVPINVEAIRYVEGDEPSPLSKAVKTSERMMHVSVQ